MRARSLYCYRNNHSIVSYYKQEQLAQQARERLTIKRKLLLQSTDRADALRATRQSRYNLQGNLNLTGYIYQNKLQSGSNFHCIASQISLSTSTKTTYRMVHILTAVALKYERKSRLSLLNRLPNNFTIDLLASPRSVS